MGPANKKSKRWKEATEKEKKELEIRTYKTTRDFASSLRLFLFERDPALANWMECQIGRNNGNIFKIHEVDTIFNDYEFQFKIGYDKYRNLTCGFAASDQDPKILTIEADDDTKNVPEVIKLCVQRFNEFLKEQTTGPWNKYSRSGHWEHVVLKLSPERKIMMVVFFHPNNLKHNQLNIIKTDLKDFFVDGGGKDAQVMSLWFQGRQMVYDKPFNDKTMLELLHGAPSYTQILAKKMFVIGPHFEFQFKHEVLEQVNKAIIKFLDVSYKTVLIEMNSGCGCIAITLANRCRKIFALPSPSSPDINETYELNKNKVPNLILWQRKRTEFLPHILNNIKPRDDVKLILCPPLKVSCIKLIRAKHNINKIVYIFSSAEICLKNLLDLSDSSGKMALKGPPFLPTEAMSIGANQSKRRVTVLLLERINPLTLLKMENSSASFWTNRNNWSQRFSKKRKLPQSGIEPSPKQGPPSDLGAQNSTKEEPPSKLLKLEQRLAELEEREKAFRPPIVPPSRPEPKEHLSPNLDNSARNVNDRSLLENASRSVPPSYLGAISETIEEPSSRLLKLEQRLAELEERKKVFKARLQPTFAFQNRPEPKEHSTLPLSNSATNANDLGGPLLLNTAARSVLTVFDREQNPIHSNDSAQTLERSLPPSLNNPKSFPLRKNNLENQDRNINFNDHSDYSDSNNLNRPHPVSLIDSFMSNLNNHTRDTSILARSLDIDRKPNTNYFNRERNIEFRNQNSVENDKFDVGNSRPLPPYIVHPLSNNHSQNTTDLGRGFDFDQEPNNEYDYRKRNGRQDRNFDIRDRNIDNRVGNFDYRDRNIDNRVGTFDNRDRNIDNRVGNFDNRDRNIDNRVGNFDNRDRNIDNRVGTFDNRDRKLETPDNFDINLSNSCNSKPSGFANDQGLPLLLDNVSRSVPSMSDRGKRLSNSNDNANTSERSLLSLLNSTRPFSSRLERERSYNNQDKNVGNRSHDNTDVDYSNRNDFLPLPPKLANRSSTNSNNHTRVMSDLGRSPDLDRELNTYGHRDPTRDLLDVHEEDRFSGDPAPANIWSRRQHSFTRFQDSNQSFSVNFSFSDRIPPPLFQRRRPGSNYYRGSESRQFSNKNFGRGGAS